MIAKMESTLKGTIMTKHLPNILTILRMVLIPVMILFFYLPFEWSRFIACWVFVAASITDFLDGYFARKHKTFSKFGAFLDPVADKLTVTTALVILLQDHPTILMMIATAIIIGREITISALREWMAELGERGSVNVAMIGKIKTVFQMSILNHILRSTLRKFNHAQVVNHIPASYDQNTLFS